MKITFDLVVLISALGGIVAIWSSIRKMLKEKEEDKKKEEDKEKKILTLLDNDKKRLDKLDKAMDDIKEHLTFQSDMIYQMLDHLATNNNSGGMKDALDRYNQHFRRNL